MGARVLSSFEIEIPDQLGEAEPWRFRVTVPPVAVMHQIHGLLSSRDEERKGAAARMFSDPEVIEAAGPEGISEQSFHSNPAVQAVIMRKYGADILLSLSDDLPADTTTALAELVLPMCGQPIGLEDDDGAPMTWDKLKQVNEPYAEAVLAGAAQQVHEHSSRGAKGRLALKKSSSSSPS